MFAFLRKRHIVAQGGQMGDVSDQADSGAIAVASRPATLGSGAPPARRGRRRMVLVGSLAAVGLLALLGLVANGFLASAYSADKAVRDYFAAQQRGDVAAMWANAQFEQPDGAYSKFFGRPALDAMMAVKANSDLRDIQVGSPTRVDSETRSVTVSMTWVGKPFSQEFTVRQDHSRSHWLLYPYWKVEVPSVPISLTLPNQAAPISLDGIAAPRSAQDQLDSIMGFHKVTMAANGLLKAQQVPVDARQAEASATVAGELQDGRMADLRVGIKRALEACDPAQYKDCVNHAYSAPNRNFIWYLTVPGSGDVNFTSYTFTERGDPAADVSVTIEPKVGIVSVHGTCAETLTMDGTRRYQLKGDYDGTMRWDGGGFYPDNLIFDCSRAKG
jgi:hypothetical protein